MIHCSQHYRTVQTYFTRLQATLLTLNCPTYIKSSPRTLSSFSLRPFLFLEQYTTELCLHSETTHPLKPQYHIYHTKPNQTVFRHTSFHLRRKTSNTMPSQTQPSTSENGKNTMNKGLTMRARINATMEQADREMRMEQEEIRRVERIYQEESLRY